MMFDVDATLVSGIVEEMRPLLAGYPSPVQGAVLADLLAIYLAGHIAPGDPKATDRWRELLLAMHIRQVRHLIPVNEAMIHSGEL